MSQQPFAGPLVDNLFNQDLQVTSARVQHHEENEAMLLQLFDRLVVNLEQRKKTLMNQLQSKFTEVNSQLLKEEGEDEVTTDLPTFFLALFTEPAPIDTEQGFT